jgi:cysteinyl-tRNA synthetase
MEPEKNNLTNSQNTGQAPHSTEPPPSEISLGGSRESTAIFPSLAGKLALHNTMTRTEEPFAPLRPDIVSLYCCGPTVYNYQHIGNIRTYIFEDILVRTLRSAGYLVNHAMNITDVGHLVSDADEGEDKMLVASKRERKSSKEIADYYTDVFFKDCEKVNITRPDTVCKATEHIQEMIHLIQRLESNGLAYQSGGNVYFDVNKFETYGALANIDLSQQLTGARIEEDSRKRSPQDFALWFTDSKFKGQELQWDSPWGKGYPGWHIECSAMALAHVGEKIDIHCGGIDHIGSHHTNEIAQTEGATGEKWVNYWLHGEFLVDATGKMSKSKGEFLTIGTLEERGFDPIAFRLCCLGAHYRSRLTFSWDNMKAAQKSLDRLRHHVTTLKNTRSPDDDIDEDKVSTYLSAFEDAIADDLHCPRALATLWDVVGDTSLSPTAALRLIEQFDNILGLELSKTSKETKKDFPEEVLSLVQQREEARKVRNWEESDRIREELLRLNFKVKDNADGSTELTKVIQ